MLSRQLIAARALVGWNQSRLASAAGVSIATVKRLENSSGIVSGRHDTVVKIINALQSAGVQFIDADRSAGPGVRLAVWQLDLLQERID